MGWRNPTHVINRRAWLDGIPGEFEVIVSAAAPATTPLWSSPSGVDGSEPVDDLVLNAGDRYPLLAVIASDDDATGTSAEAYGVWYQLALPDGRQGWVQAAIPTASDTGSDGRPSSIRFDLLPNVGTPE
jgi:hypothetical protein